MMVKVSKIKLGKIFGPFLLLALAVGFAWASNDDLYSMLRLFERVAIAVSDRYIEKPEPSKIINAGIDGMMEELDQYSRYLSEQEYALLMQETQGEYIGVGLELEMHLDTVRVSSIIEGSPAFATNIGIGDRLIRIDTTNVIGMSDAQCRRLLRGDPDSKVTITFERPTPGREFRVELSRAKIHISSIPAWCVDENNIGCIKLSRFSEGCAGELRNIVSLLKDRGVKGIIVDLRNNPGGLLYEAVEAVSVFLNAGDRVVETNGRGSASRRDYDVFEDGNYNVGPLVVVINGRTASAAEIFAGAIQDLDRGLVIGSASYGKGLVQQVLHFSDNSALKLTTAKYYTPSNRCIQKEITVAEDTALAARRILHHTKSGRPVFGGGGIIPDLYVEPPERTALIEEITTAGYAFDFVSEYGPGMKVEADFKVDDKLINRFYSYLASRGYVYHDEADLAFRQFAASYEPALGGGQIENQIDKISDYLSRRSRDELQSLRPQIKELLYESFIRRRMDSREAYHLLNVANDPELQKARDAVNHPEAYENLLAGY